MLILETTGTKVLETEGHTEKLTLSAGLESEKKKVQRGPLDEVKT